MVCHGRRCLLARNLHVAALSTLLLSAVAATQCPRHAELDTFDEALHVQLVPFTHSPRRFLAHFEFKIKAPLSVAFRADQFDLFPKPIGKLLNAHRAITAFEATLTRGRWKKDEWGPPPREFRPPGAVLVAATNTSDTSEAKKAWKFLISALSGAMCASFEGMDPDHGSSVWVRPLSVPWMEPGRQLRFATLPYEPVCTENLTPWLKLLPCGRHRGLPTLMAPLELAKAPLLSLSIVAAIVESEAAAELHASLDVVLPLKENKRALAAWFEAQSFTPCPAAQTSRVMLQISAAPPLELEAKSTTLVVRNLTSVAGESLVLFPTSSFNDVANPLRELALATPEQGPKPWAIKRAGDEVMQEEGLQVMRDILSQEGRSERTHGRYLLRFTNFGRKRRVRFMDQLPFFIQPLWHTFHTTIQRSDAGIEELTGLSAMRRLELQFVPRDGEYGPTEVFLTVDVPPAAVVSIFLDVLKRFIQLREFSYACEKGFDVSSAAWLEIDLPDGEHLPGAASGFVQTSDLPLPAFSATRLPGEQAEDPAASKAKLPARAAWQLRFTEGLIVLVPMPDFSMPFNVIALSSTAVTFFFGSMFRLTAAGRTPHWVLRKEQVAARGVAFFVKRLVLALMLVGSVALHQAEEHEVKELRNTLPADMGPLVDFLESAKGAVDKITRR